MLTTWNKLALILLLSCSARTVLATKCYSCDNDSSSDNLCLKNATQQYVVECNNQTEMYTGRCYQSEWWDDKAKFMKSVRRCGRSNDYCKDNEGKYKNSHVILKYKCCDTDLCNSGVMGPDPPVPDAAFKVNANFLCAALCSLLIVTFFV